MTKQDGKCSLLPYDVEEVVSLQSAEQKIGWGITAFDLPKAWETTQGEGVKIAVLDSGCDLDHPDLAANLLPGMNMINPKLTAHDDNQHGTHVSGIISAVNNDIGMVGVAPKSKIIPVKVLDKNGNGSLSNVSKGIRWAVDNGADIITMSLGAPRPLQSVRKSIQYAYKKACLASWLLGTQGKRKRFSIPLPIQKL